MPLPQNKQPDLNHLRRELVEHISSELDSPTMGFTVESFRAQARPLFKVRLPNLKVKLSDDIRLLWRMIESEFVGYGPVDRLLEDDAITYVHMLSDARIYVTQDEQQVKLDKQIFDDREHYIRTVWKLFPVLFKDGVTPLVNTLNDGSVAHCLFPQTDYLGPFVIIQKATRQSPQ